MKTIMSAVIFLAANAIGLFIATLVLSNFTIDFWSFIFVVVVFSVILALLTPALRKLGEKKFPAMLGGLSLVTIFGGLFVTDLIMAGMDIGGLKNWFLATILIWIGSLVAGAILPRVLGTNTPRAK